METTREVSMTTEETSEENIVKPITRKTLLESGAHYGHKPSVWNPKMATYIFGQKDDTYIIDLDNTLKLWKKAQEAVFNHVSKGGTILFVGRRRKAVPLIIEESLRSGAFYMAGKWPGGTLTNFDTIQNSIKRMVSLEKFIFEVEDGKKKLAKAELMEKKVEVAKLQKKFNGIREMKAVPGMIFVTHSTIDRIAIEEARALQIPVIGIADTDTDPDPLDFVIPANDDSALCLQLFISNMAQTVLEARTEYEFQVAKQVEENEQAAQDFIAAELE